MSNTLLQPAAFLTLLYGGIAAGIAYDVFRLLRRLIKRMLADTICDALFILCALAAAAAALLNASGGLLRPYLCAGYVAGFFLEQWSLSHIFFKFIHSIASGRP